MPDPSVKHEEEGIESQLIAHSSSRVVALQERVDRLEVAIARLPRYMLVLGTDVTASCFEGLLDLLLSHRIGSALGEDDGVRLVGEIVEILLVLEIRDHLPLARCARCSHGIELMD